MFKQAHFTYFIFLIASAFLFQACEMQEEEAVQTITEEMVQEAQNEWIDGLSAIGEADDPEAVATEVLNRHYDFDGAGVLFKPTLAHGDQSFRFTREGALSYFVGGNENYPDDAGFALSNYVEGTAVVENVIVQDNIAISMSRISLVSETGDIVTVDKTFAYRMDDEGNLRIITHHSSLPYMP